jgi:hypothetical protein
MADDGKTLALPKASAGREARVGDNRIALGVIVDGSMGQPVRVRVNRKAFDRKGATAIPSRRPATFYIVSSITAQAFPERDDFLIPDEIIRDERGEVTGCRAVAQLWPATNQVAKEAIENAKAAIGPHHEIASER